MASRIRRRARAAAYEPPALGEQYQAFLDQARWTLAAQQARSTTFATSAGMVLGFDGVILAVFATAGGLDGTAGPGEWLARASAVLVTVSAICTLGALVPRRPASVDWPRIVGAWAAMHPREGESVQVEPRQLFAQLIFAYDANGATPPAERRGLLSWRTKGSTPIEAASAMAESRGKWFATSVLALLVGLVLLMSSLLLGTGATDIAPGPEPASTNEPARS